MSERDWERDWDLCQAATPGQWKKQNKRIEAVDLPHLPPIAELLWHREVNGDFIAAAREALPYWLQRVGELEAKVEQLDTELDDMADNVTAWIDRAKTAEIRVRELQEENRRLKAVVEAAKALATWMQWWLDEDLCDCEDAHICGRMQRQQELDRFCEALAALPKGGPGDGKDELLETLKRVVLDIAERVDDGGDLLDMPCPDDYGLPKNCPREGCRLDTLKMIKNFDVLPCVNEATKWNDPPPFDDRWINAVCKAAELVKFGIIAAIERAEKEGKE